MKEKRRLVLMIPLVYAVSVVSIELLALGRGSAPLTKAAPRDAPIAAIVFYTDDPPVRQTRVQAAVEQFKLGHASLLIMAGGSRPLREGGYQGASVMRSHAIGLGVPAEYVITDRGSNDTISNLSSSIDILREIFDIPFRVTLVTDRLHLLRLSLIVGITDLKTPLLRYPIQYLDTGELAFGFGRFARLNHELLAYVSLLLPRQLTKYILAQTRQS